jgi:hypothetical protein
LTCVPDTTVAVKPGGAVGGVSSGGGSAIEGLLAYAAMNAATEMAVHFLDFTTFFSQNCLLQAASYADVITGWTWAN